MKTKKLTTKEVKVLRGKLLSAGYTVTEVANKFKVTRQFAHQSLQGEHRSPLAIGIRGFICKTTGVAEKEAWPNL